MAGWCKRECLCIFTIETVVTPNAFQSQNLYFFLWWYAAQYICGEYQSTDSLCTSKLTWKLFSPLPVKPPELICFKSNGQQQLIKPCWAAILKGKQWNLLPWETQKFLVIWIISISSRTRKNTFLYCFCWLSNITIANASEHSFSTEIPQG